MKPNFSVVLIGKNEEHTLPRLMNSLTEFRNLGGEIILVDTGSTDKTVEVAKSFGATVSEQGERFIKTISEERAAAINAMFTEADGEEPLVKAGDKLFDYSEARNFAATLASNDMIATPDCDEAYTKLDLAAITGIIDQGFEQLEYNFVFSHDAEGNEMVKFMHSKFYNRKKLKWTGIIHEVLTGIEKGVDVKRVFMPEAVIKLEHWQNTQTNRSHYLKGLAIAVMLDPENDRNAHYLGRELLYTGRLKSAIRQLKKHIAMNKWPAEKSQSMIHIAEAHAMMGNWDNAVAWYMNAFNEVPTRREPLMKIAEHYYKLGMVDHVIAYVSAALQIKGDNFYANFQPYYENMPHEMMYWALWQKKELRASKTHFDICLGYQPFNQKYLHDFRFYYELPKMSIVIPTLGRPEGLVGVLKSIDRLNYPKDKIEVIVVSDGEKVPEETKTLFPTYKFEELETRLGVPKALKHGVKIATGEWIVYAANDTEFLPETIINAFKTAMDNNKFFMAFNTGEVSPDEGNICEHFMIHKKLLPKIGGDIFDLDFNHVGVDNLLWAKMKKMNQAMWCKRAVMVHNHFSRTGAAMDSVAQIAWDPESVKKDRELLAKKLSRYV